MQVIIIRYTRASLCIASSERTLPGFQRRDRTVSLVARGGGVKGLWPKSEFSCISQKLAFFSPQSLEIDKILGIQAHSAVKEEVRDTYKHSENIVSVPRCEGKMLEQK